MKSNQPIAMLVGILLIATAISAWNIMRYTSRLRERQRLEITVTAKVADLQKEESLTSALATDAVEYSKKNPQINSILKEFGLPTGGNVPAAGGKSATR